MNVESELLVSGVGTKRGLTLDLGNTVEKDVSLHSLVA